jgi:uncharacterized protein YdeI (YjbR/CyaY-like superfamily)
MEAVFFSAKSEFRKWLELHHKSEKEVLVGYYKVATGKPSISWSESVDEALCFGWIDGIRKSIDVNCYSIRFTPRNPSSNWSAINIKKAEDLIKSGQMKPEGLELFQKRQVKNSIVYSYENKPETLPEHYRNLFIRNEKAFEFFTSLAPSYQKTMYYWVMSAKQESTQLARLEKLINSSENHKRVF